MKPHIYKWRGVWWVGARHQFLMDDFNDALKFAKGHWR